MHVVVHADRFILVDVMTLWRHEKVWSKCRITPQRANTLQYVSRVEMKNFSVHNNLGSCKLGTARKLLVDNFVELDRVPIR